eukprot:12992747-Alexandrium_andersonii.AAC.1
MAKLAVGSVSQAEGPSEPLFQPLSSVGSEVGHAVESLCAPPGPALHLAHEETFKQLEHPLRG